MTWEQLVKGQSKEYKGLLLAYKSAADQLAADKKMLLGTYTEATAPGNIRDKISRDQDAFNAEWSMDGRRFTALREAHTAEIIGFFEQSEC